MFGKLFDKGLRHADFLLQSHVCLVQELLIEDPCAVAGAGIFAAEDWNRVRQRRNGIPEPDQGRYASDAGYLRYLDSIHEGKIRSVRSLMKDFNLDRYERIMELGCGDMPQAYIIHSQYPQISYTATDFDPKVIESCSRLPLLKGIRKFVLDVTRDDLGELRNYNLVSSWSLEFSLEDMQLTKLFAACRNYAVPYLLCTHAAIGPIGYFCAARARREQRRKVNENRLRLFGRLRSVGEIARLARGAGMNLRWKAYHVNHAALFFTPQETHP